MKTIKIILKVLLSLMSAALAVTLMVLVITVLTTREVGWEDPYWVLVSAGMVTSPLVYVFYSILIKLINKL